LYGEDDCRFALGKYATDIEALTVIELFVKNNVKQDTPRMLVKFPIIPHDNLNNLLIKYSLGLVSWDFLLESTRSLSGYSSWDSDDFKKQKEPWSKEEKMMLFGMRMKKSTGRVEEKRDEREKEPKEKKKRKLEESESLK
jgi:hypothetical protein